jgi:hypothetical protein
MDVKGTRWEMWPGGRIVSVHGADMKISTYEFNKRG